MIEQLTDEERFWIRRFHGCAHIDKALRIIDANAADRAALVAQLETAKALAESRAVMVDQHEAGMVEAEAEIARLTEGAKKAESDNQRLLRKIEEYQERVQHLEQDSATTHAALVAQVAELIREQDEARANVEGLRGSLHKHCDAHEKTAGLLLGANASLAAANALVKRLIDGNVSQYAMLKLRAHLAAQPATAPARDEVKRLPPRHIPEDQLGPVEVPPRDEKEERR